MGESTFYRLNALAAALRDVANAAFWFALSFLVIQLGRAFSGVLDGTMMFVL